jgi:hypothetical protein
VTAEIDGAYFGGRAVQRFILSLFSNMVQGSEGANEKEDSQEDFSLNLCLATAFKGGRHEVVRTFSFAARNDPRPTPRGAVAGVVGI